MGDQSSWTQQNLNRVSLKVARKNVGLTTTEATKKMFRDNALNIDRVKSWERGETFPTYKQLEKLADFYNVNVLQLFIQDDLETVEEPPVFRSKPDLETSYNLYRFIHILRIRQSILRSNIIKDGGRKNELVGSGRRYEKPAQLADFIREKLNYNTDKKDVQQTTFSYLRSLLHKQYIFVFKTMSTSRDVVDVEEMKGLYLNDEYAPCIAINRRDHKNSQLFTLAHEIAHLFRAEERIDSIQFRAFQTLQNKEEAFCNQVAAHLLIPGYKIKSATMESDSDLLQYVKRLALENKVSNLVSLFRLVDAGFINQRQLKVLKGELDLEYQESLNKEKKQNSGGNYYNNMRDSNGQLFNEFVFSLHVDGRLNLVEAQKLLKIPLSEI